MAISLSAYRDAPGPEIAWPPMAASLGLKLIHAGTTAYAIQLENEIEVTSSRLF